MYVHTYIHSTVDRGIAHAFHYIAVWNVGPSIPRAPAELHTYVRNCTADITGRQLTVLYRLEIHYRGVYSFVLVTVKDPCTEQPYVPVSYSLSSTVSTHSLAGPSLVQIPHLRLDGTPFTPPFCCDGGSSPSASPSPCGLGEGCLACNVIVVLVSGEDFLAARRILSSSIDKSLSGSWGEGGE